MNYNKFKPQGSHKTLRLTKKGLDNLRKKLDEITLRRFKAVKELRSIDKSDADEPIIAMQIQNLENTEAEVAELSELLQRVEPVIKEGVPESISVGCTVGLKNGEMPMLYTIVSPLELDTENNKVSEDSVLGRAILGKKQGDRISITTPKGTAVSYEIISIE